MKKTLLLGFIFILISVRSNSFSQSNKSIVTTDCKVDSVTERVLLNRLADIRMIDKSKLTHEERKALRKEVKEIKAKLNIVPIGIYISTAALILISVLLIALI